MTTPSKSITVRVRCKDGMFRVDNIDPRSTTLHHLKQELQQLTNVPADQQVITVAPQQQLQQQPPPLPPQDDRLTLQQCGIVQHGQMIHMQYDATKIKSKQDLELEQKKSERERLLGDSCDVADIDNLGLRLRQKNWTMSEYLQLVEKHKVVIKHQKYAVCTRISVDQQAAHHFQLFLREIAFSKQRVGYLFGTQQPSKRSSDEEEGGSPSPQSQSSSSTTSPTSGASSGAAKEADQNENSEEHEYKELFASVIYEPPQDFDSDSTEFNEMQDEHARRESDRVDELAHLLGMERVGWVVTHDGTRDYPLSAREILKAAELQAKYGDYFVTLTMFRNEAGESEFEAFQVSKQCVDLFKRGLLKPHDSDPELVLTTKPVEIQRKRINEIEGLLLITNVAITSWQSPYRVGFPIENRPVHFYPEYMRSRDKARAVLQQRRNLSKFVEKITDFHLLLWLCDSMDFKSDMPVIAAAVRAQDEELVTNYELIINHICGIEI